jgi:hypothetical protein
LTASTILIAREQALTKAALDREKERTREAQDQRARALAGFLQARRALDFISQVSEDELAGKPGMQRVRRRLLAAALEFYQSFVEQYADDPAMQGEIARSHLRSGRILAELHADIDALAEMERARQLQAKQVADNPGDRRTAARLGFVEYYIYTLQGCSSMALLRHKVTQDDLEMTPVQRKQVRDLAERLAEQRRGLAREGRPKVIEDQRVQLEEMTAGNEQAALDILTTAQGERLRQIALQVQGFNAFADPQVEEALQLTTEQKQKIVEQQAEAYTALWEYFSQIPGQEAGRKTPEQIREAAQSSILRLLSADQVARWDKLRGMPFKGEMYFGNRKISIHR